jgi:hypothetical protein
LTIAREKLERYTEQFVLAMQIDQVMSDTSSDCHNLETKRSDTLFGSWRQSDEDEGEKGIKGERNEYLEGARV